MKVKHSPHKVSPRRRRRHQKHQHCRRHSDEPCLDHQRKPISSLVLMEVLHTIPATLHHSKRKHKKNRVLLKKHSSTRVMRSPSILSTDQQHHISALPDATWCLIQDMITDAKSLGDISRITLTFFKEHEAIQTKNNLIPVFPIIIPASEVYNMLVPRKRRIYDVLHVLEGIGVIKRVRFSDVNGSKGGCFLYYGREAAICRLIEIKDTTCKLVQHLQQTHGKDLTVDELDSMLLKSIEDHADIEKWPCLTTTTTSFLTLLFQQDYHVAVALPGMSTRLIEAKKRLGSGTVSDSSHADVNRRVYDVVSVLASCNLILTSVTSDFSEIACEPVDKFSPRKHVRFNYDVFCNPNRLWIADKTAKQLSSSLKRGRSSRDDDIKRIRKRRGPKQPSTELNMCLSPSVKTWKSLALDSSVDCTFQEGLSESEEQEQYHYGGIKIEVPDQTSLNAELPVDLRVKINFSDEIINSKLLEKNEKNPQRWLQHTNQLDVVQHCVTEDNDLATSSRGFHCPIGDLFSTKSSQLQNNQEWWDESLKELVFHDALPTVDRIDWELMNAINAERIPSWGEQPTNYPSFDRAHASMEDLVVDLECHESFPDDEEPTDMYFC